MICPKCGQVVNKEDVDSYDFNLEDGIIHMTHLPCGGEISQMEYVFVGDPDDDPVQQISESEQRRD